MRVLREATRDSNEELRALSTSSGRLSRWKVFVDRALEAVASRALIARQRLPPAPNRCRWVLEGLY
jgi:hypothetical protein